MEIAVLTKRIADKETAISKLERLLTKYLSETEPAEAEIINRFLQTGDRSEYHSYLKSNNRYYGGDAWSKANELYDARQCLAKYNQQLKAENDRQATLNSLPSVIVEFRDSLINRWDRYDAWKQDQIRNAIKSEPSWSDRDNYRKWHHEMRERWGADWYEFSHLSDSEIHKRNSDAADALVLNLINRTIESCGTITDASGLSLDQDNQGYLIINGIVIGESGKARVESIGAGGYNIQRYHIRVLVKPVK